jgi:hypothetical protein
LDDLWSCGVIKPFFHEIPSLIAFLRGSRGFFSQEKTMKLKTNLQIKVEKAVATIVIAYNLGNNDIQELIKSGTQTCIG